MLQELLKQLSGIKAEALAALRNAKSDADIEEVKNRTLGRNGAVTALREMMGKIPPESKREAGMAFNETKNAIQEALDAAREKTQAAKDAAKAIDVTLPGRRPAAGRLHPVTRTIEECCEIFRRMGFAAVTGPEIEDVWHNFDALNAPLNHPSRDPQDTFYLPDGRLLRTQTSAVQIRTMNSMKPPVRIISPGRCYRRDTPDATHGVYFHQIEGLYIDKEVSLADLRSTLMVFAKEYFGQEIAVRMRPSFFPFTEPSVEFDFSCVMCEGKGCNVCKNSGWLELGGAGMVNPKVLENVGYNPEEVQGYAFGFGLERLTMLKRRINDLRIFSDNDLRFLKQF